MYFIHLCVSLSACWCWSGCVCGSPAGKNCVCGTKTFSCSVTDRTTATLVRRNKTKNNCHNKPLLCWLLHQQCSTSTLLFAHKLINVVIVFGHFAGVTALIELPKNCIAAAMDKEIGKRQILMTRMLNNYSNWMKSTWLLKNIDQFLLGSDLQADSLYWFLSINVWDPLSVRPPGPDSSSYQRQWSVRPETLNHH